MRTHLLDGYISANQRCFSTFLSKITKYNRVHLESRSVVSVGKEYRQTLFSAHYVKMDSQAVQ